MTGENMKAQGNDGWLWVIDEEMVQSLLGQDAPKPESPRREVNLPDLAKAIALGAEGRREEALAVLVPALEAQPESAESWWARGQLEFELGRFEEARQSYSEVIARRQPQHWAPYFNRALSLEKLDRFEEAGDDFRKAGAMAPERPEPLVALGSCLLRQKKPKDALREFENCLKPNPDESRALFGKAVALQMLERHDEALEIYRAILPQHANNIELLVNLIALAVARQDEVKVRDYSERLLRVRPQARPALESLATLALARADYKTAAQHCANLVKVAADSWEAWYNLGFVYQKTARPDKAIEAYREAIRLKPEAEQPHANLGLVLQERGDMSGARAEYECALGVNPEAAAVLWNMALLLERAGEVTAAEATLGRLLALKPDWEDASFRLGSLRLQLGDDIGACEAFGNCLRKRGDWAEAHLNLGIALARTGERERARQEIDTAATLKPKSIPALTAQAVVALDDGDAEKALRVASDLRELGEKAPEIFYNAGILLQRGGLRQDAAAAFRQAVDDRPGFAEALLNLGHALESLGQHEEAVVCWQEAVETRPELAQSYF